MKNFFCILLLAVSSHAATLTCTFGPAPDYQCNYWSLSPVTQVNEAITVSNPPISSYVDKVTSFLDLAPPLSIQQFPRRIFKIFTNLEAFNGLNISTTELGANSFTNCKNLKYISFMYSNLGNFRAGFASTCSAVTNFQVYGCNIQSIDKDAFKGMTSVEFLSLQSSGITCLHRKVFQPMKKLTTLDLSYNQITAVHSQLFTDLTVLNLINLMGNLITYIPNLNLNRTGISHVTILFQQNHIMAISPLLLSSFNNGRELISYTPSSISFYPYNPSSFVTCVDPNLGDFLYQIIHSENWIEYDERYRTQSTCYSSFTKEMGSDKLAKCGIKKRAKKSSSSESGSSSSEDN